MAKKSPPTVQKLDGAKTRAKKAASPVVQAITPAMIENVQYLINRLLTSFPATPKITSPEPGGFWSAMPYFDPLHGVTFVAMVGIKTNKTAVAHHLTVLDLTDPTIIIPPTILAAPIPPTFWTYVVATNLVAGHDYRLRIQVDPAVATPADEFDTVYVTLF